MPRTTDAPGEAGVDDIMHDLRVDAGDTLALIRHGQYIQDGLVLVAEIERLRAELAKARPVVAAARAWCHTYAVRDLTPQESALMTAVAAWEEAAAPPG